MGDYIFGRYAFRQDLLCQHSHINKGSHGHAASSRSTGCKAFVTCKIKLINKNTRKNDSFLMQVSNSCVTVIIMSLCWYYNICESPLTWWIMTLLLTGLSLPPCLIIIVMMITTGYSHLLHREAVEHDTFVLSCILAAHQNYRPFINICSKFTSKC